MLRSASELLADPSALVGWTHKELCAVPRAEAAQRRTFRALPFIMASDGLDGYRQTLAGSIQLGE